MIENTRLPEELSSIVGSERKEFVIKAGRAQPYKKSFSLILFGFIWTAFTSIFVVAFLGPLFHGKDVHFESNGVSTVANHDNLSPILMPALIIGFFVLVGIIMLSYGIYSMVKKGGYFVGTPTRLIHYYNGKIRSIDWELFSGDIELSGNKLKGNISLQMRTGKMVSSKNGPDRYVPDVIYISEIPYVFEIEEICRGRIKENDPTPPMTRRNIS